MSESEQKTTADDAQWSVVVVGGGSMGGALVRGIYRLLGARAALRVCGRDSARCRERLVR